MPGGDQIVVVDDDQSVRESIAEYLFAHGYGVRVASCGRELDRLLAERPADLIILDVMMPEEDGLAVCQRLSLRGTHILMLSALADMTDRVVGLELGADDYLAKPFEPRELLARIRAVLRRSSIAGDGEERLFLFSGWRYSAAQGSLLSPQGEHVPLTQAEHVLLSAFLERPGRVLDREQILRLTHGPSAEPFDRAVDLSVSRLRRKLGPLGQELIETVRGGGYRFRPPVRRA